MNFESKNKVWPLFSLQISTYSKTSLFFFSYNMCFHCIFIFRDANLSCIPRTIYYRLQIHLFQCARRKHFVTWKSHLEFITSNFWLLVIVRFLPCLWYPTYIHTSNFVPTAVSTLCLVMLLVLFNVWSWQQGFEKHSYCIAVR